MFQRGLSLHEILTEILQSPFCYFESPTGLEMSYPCIIYKYAGDDTRFADNKRYKTYKCYTITVVDTDSESAIQERLKDLPYCSFDRVYESDGLYHFVFRLYFKGPRIKEENQMVEKKKVMICQPMNGLSVEEIQETKDKVVEKLESEGYEIVDSFFKDEFSDPEILKENGVVQIPVHFLSKSLDKMSYCHAVYFCKGWEKARGCKIEHDVAVAYGLTVLYDEEEENENE